MDRRFVLPLLSLPLVLLFATEKANADATFSSSVVTCSSFSATGTVTSA